MVHVVFNFFEPVLRDGPKFTFPSAGNDDELKAFSRCCPLVPSLDVFCMALILLALKYLYNLDDMTEVAATRNLPAGAFNLVRWLHLSKLRAYMAVTRNKDLNYKFQCLYPRVCLRSTTRNSYISIQGRLF